MYNTALAETKKALTLKTEGRLVVNAEGKKVKLVGVNCAGLEWMASGDKIIDRVTMAFDEWKSNIIRLPISQDRWFGYAPDQSDDRDGEKYRTLVDEIIDMATARDKYILFELHWSNTGRWGEKIGQHKMPDTYSINFWHDAASRYANHPAVLFGLYNEPYRIPWDVWQSGGYNAEEECSAIGMQTLINTVRNQAASNILVIGGVDWAYDLRGVLEYPLNDRNGNGIIYDSHIYPWKPAPYDTYIPLSVAEKYPILIGECGHYGDRERIREGNQRSPYTEWVPEILNYIRDNDYHVTAWDFHFKAGPCLLQDPEGTPTPYWGTYFKQFCIEANS